MYAGNGNQGGEVCVCVCVCEGGGGIVGGGGGGPGLLRRPSLVTE